MSAARETPRVSVLLPVRNGEAYLRRSIESVLQQSLGEFELLVGDDCSTDSSSAIVEAVWDPRIRYVKRVHNLGLFANLNQLVKASRAPVLKFLCQDDQLEPDCLEHENAFLTAHRELPMTFSKSRTVDARGAEVGRDELGDLPDILSPSLTWQLFLYHGCIPGNLSTVCARRATVERAGGFDTSFSVAGDYDLWVRLCSGVPLGVIHEHLVRLRRHSGQLSRAPRSAVAFIQENRRIRQRLWKLVPSQDRRAARLYLSARPGVLSTHYLLKCVLGGEFRLAAEVARVLGPQDLAAGLAFWFITANNRLYRPRPPFRP
jgi:glycosyltransferase involved in cell wall biosynthesis